ncbi:hypothetical protein AAT19DRAFT_10799 [Rhodotorula toruloides]|uniref:Uncharacterized protein n=1 Tax=Rhodotorula toruloides TaxID=5286 RepID=A0A2S9ZY19_RHOTO|nr:hypothetical protein AAT19DRAFT_10799 [Rhodotorula toruloides]
MPHADLDTTQKRQRIQLASLAKAESKEHDSPSEGGDLFSRHLSPRRVVHLVHLHSRKIIGESFCACVSGVGIVILARRARRSARARRRLRSRPAPSGPSPTSSSTPSSISNPAEHVRTWEQAERPPVPRLSAASKAMSRLVIQVRAGPSCVVR